MTKFEIRAPIPGTFYAKPAPDVARFKDDGSDVAEGDQIGLIEVMKTFIPVHADITARNIVFLVEDGEPVMAGQVIAEAEA